MEKNKITIPINAKTHLVYRVTNISKAVLLVRQVPEDPGVIFGGEETEQAIIATSAAGCSVIGEALQEMAVKIRELPKDKQ